jgi:hypothetical protein
MSFQPTRSEPPDEFLDGLLRAYFQKEMPRPWPAPLPPARPAPLPASPRGSGSTRTRLALAASLAFLTVGSVLVADRIHPNAAAPASVPLDNGEARRPNDLRAPDHVKTRLWMEQDPMGSTSIKVDVITEDASSPK